MSEKTHEVIPRADSLPVGVQLHPLVERMLAQNPTPETLRELLALQREWEADEAKRAFTQALVALKRDLPPWIERDAKVEYTSAKGRTYYTHASLAGAMEAVLPHLCNHGFSISWTPTTEKGAVKVTAKLTHHKGHSEQATLEAPADVSGNKNPAQAIASTITLLERYSALALLGLATADMKEPGDGANGTHEATSAASDTIDSARNLRAVRALAEAGRTREAAEAFLGRKVPQWTLADIDRLKAWIKPAPQPEPAALVEEAADREPGSDEGESAPLPETKKPPEQPKDGDEWKETVIVVAAKAAPAGKAPRWILDLEHVSGAVTKHSTWHKTVGDLAAKVAGKGTLVTCAFAAKLNADQSQLYINVESMEIEPEESEEDRKF